MKILKKLIGLLILILVIVVTMALVARNAIIKRATQKALEQYTGFNLDVDKIHVGLLKPTFEIQGLVLKNPVEFPESTAFEVKTIRVDYDFLSFFSEEIHLTKVVVDIPKANMVVKADGESNLDRLTGLAGLESKDKPREPSGDKPPAKEDASGKSETKKFRIDEISIRLGKVAVYDFSVRGKKPYEFEHDLGVDIHLRNVTRPDQIISPLIVQLGMAVALNADYLASKIGGKIENIAESAKDQVKALEEIAEENLGGILGEDAEKIGEYSEKAQEVLKDLSKDGSKALEEAGPEVKQAAEELQKAFGSFLKGISKKDEE